MNHEITRKLPLLDGKGRLTDPGWASRMNFLYNREQAKITPFNLKEWNFYQIMNPPWVVQLTIGHTSYMCSASVNLLNLTTGRRWELGRMKPFFIPVLDRNPEGPSLVEFREKGLLLRFEVTDRARRLTCLGRSKQWGAVEVSLTVESRPENLKLVIATPFGKPHQFYLNCKENYYRASGAVSFGNLTVSMDGASGLLDWGRGIWPYRHEWYWGSLSAVLADGAELGLNIGWGFGDLRRATENIFFYKRKAYKLGVLQVEGNCPTAPCCLWDGEGNLELRFTPSFDNYTQNKLLVIDTHCHQVYGRFDGYVLADEGKVELHGLPGFIEHAVNRW